jgi:hypothetical protein
LQGRRLLSLLGGPLLVHIFGQAWGSGVNKTAASVIAIGRSFVSLHIHPTPQDEKDLSQAACRALEVILTPLRGGSMQDPASELRRIPLPRTLVNNRAGEKPQRI